MKPKTEFINKFIELAKKHCEEDIYEDYIFLREADKCPKQKSLSIALVDFDASEHPIFINEVIELTKRVFDLKTFEYEGITYTFDNFDPVFIFTQIIKIYIGEYNTDELDGWMI